MSARLADLKQLLVGPASLLLRLIYRVLSCTYRYELVHPERLATILARNRPLVVSFWHDQIFAAVPFLDKRLHRAGLEITLLASHSRDGELVARFVRPWKIRVVRGSSSRGGQAAMRGLHRTIVKDGSSPLVVPDGPRGPRYVAKVGAVLLARFARVPVQPLGIAAQRSWRLGSWDRMVVPKPFSRVVVVIGEPLDIPRDLDEAETESYRLELEETLCALRDEAIGSACAA